MATVMQSGGRRCDSRCHNAKGHKCNCICGGQNHGIGLLKAIELSNRDQNDFVVQGQLFPEIKPKKRRSTR